LILAMSLLLPAQEQWEQAIVTNIEGEVRVLRPKTTYWHPASLEEILLVGDTVETGDRSSAELTFLDGNVVELGADSVLKIDQLGKYDKYMHEELGLEKGKLLSTVRKGSSFSVRTPQAVAAVRGTEFAVAVDEGESQVGVFDGSVSVKHYESEGKLSSSEVVLKKNYETLIKQYLSPDRPQRLGERMRKLQDRMVMLRERQKKRDEEMRERQKGKMKDKKETILNKRGQKKKGVEKYLKDRQE